MTYRSKVNIMTERYPFARVSDTVSGELVLLLEKGLTKQVTANAAFHKKVRDFGYPQGESYPWCTYSKCTDAKFTRNELQIYVYDGDSFHGKRDGIRDAWSFELTDAVLELPSVRRIIDSEWEEFIEVAYECQQRAERNAAVQAIGKQLLQQYTEGPK